MGPLLPIGAAIGFLLLLTGGGKGAVSSGDRGMMVTDPSQILDAKRKLGIWGSTEHAIVPSGYPSMADLTPSIDARFVAAVRSFQDWVNETASDAGRLRSDGVLDPQTKDAIDAYASDVNVTVPAA